ncbi:MAG: DinB family protein [Chitinophagaceae bacterium]|nr:DinB family protein [Chitinophagaceae bacterium]
MTRLSLFKNELEKEAIATRKMLAAVPNDKYDWKPHPKSMSIRQLATHIAELPTWPGMVLNTTELDFATMDYKPTEINDTATLLKTFEKCLQDGLTQLTNGNEATMDEPWTLRNGEQIYLKEPKADVIRTSISQIIHHRAQLGVFLRLLDVPIPGAYGPSADESF